MIPYGEKTIIRCHGEGNTIVDNVMGRNTIVIDEGITYCYCHYTHIPNTSSFCNEINQEAFCLQVWMLMREMQKSKPQSKCKMA